MRCAEGQFKSVMNLLACAGVFQAHLAMQPACPPASTQLAPAAQQQQQAAADNPEQLRLAIPHSFDELRSVRHTLQLYRQSYAVHVAALLVAVHMFLQSFMIPGSILINVLAGSMYSLPGG